MWGALQVADTRNVFWTVKTSQWDNENTKNYLKNENRKERKLFENKISRTVCKSIIDLQKLRGFTDRHVLNSHTLYYSLICVDSMRRSTMHASSQTLSKRDFWDFCGECYGNSTAILSWLLCLNAINQVFAIAVTWAIWIPDFKTIRLSKKPTVEKIVNHWACATAVCRACEIILILLLV